jgi:hypothetical protein
MIHSLIKALQEQNVAEDKIRFIIDNLNGNTDTTSGNGLWRSLCESCLEVGIDPQALFALAATYNNEDLPDSLELE